MLANVSVDSQLLISSIDWKYIPKKIVIASCLWQFFSEMYYFSAYLVLIFQVSNGSFELVKCEMDNGIESIGGNMISEEEVEEKIENQLPIMWVIQPITL